MRLLIALALVGAMLAACGQQPCLAAPPRRLTGSSPCVLPDAGAFAPDSGFSLKVFLDGSPISSCAVSVDPSRGRIALDVGTAVVSCQSSGAAAPREPPIATCKIPPLPAGQYTIDTQPETVFTLPAADAGIPACP